MIAGRAYLGGLFANDDMAAVAALPHLDLFPVGKAFWRGGFQKKL